MRKRFSRKRLWIIDGLVTWRTLKINSLCVVQRFFQDFYFCCNVQIYIWIHNLIINKIHTSCLFSWHSLFLTPRISEEGLQKSLWGHPSCLKARTATGDCSSVSDKDWALWSRINSIQMPTPQCWGLAGESYNWKSGVLALELSAYFIGYILVASSFFYYFWGMINSFYFYGIGCTSNI